MKTKVLILHTSVGYGIKVTAENIFEQLRESEGFEPRIEDLQKVERGGLTTLIEKIYSWILNRAAFVWGFLYESKFILWLTMPLRKPAAAFKSKKVLELLREFQPAIVISTQTASTGIVAYLKSRGLYRGKLVAVFSDFHFHPFWTYPEVDLYLCSIPEQIAELKNMGVPDEKIALTGIIVSQKFFQELSRENAKSEIGLLQSMPMVLMTNGAQTRESSKDVFLKLLRSQKTFQVVVVCGRNDELKKEFEAISAPSNHPVKIFGFVDNMEVLMSAADVMVGKTGGPTMGEAVIKKLPMVITDIRPGHEQINLDYLLSNGLVRYGRISREVVYLVEQMLEGKIKMDHQKNFETIIQPKGAILVVDALDRVNPEPNKIKVKNYQNS